MRHLSITSFIGSLVAFCTACNQTPEEYSQEIEGISSDTIVKEDSSNSSYPIVNIQEIKDCALQGITSFNMDSISIPKTKLRMSFVNDTLSQIPVNEKESWRLSTSEYALDEVKCYQWEENQDYFAFSVLQQDESCCLVMYLILCTNKGELLAIQSLGLKGGDGGWWEKDWGEKNDFVNFKLYRDSNISTDQFDSGGNDLGSLRENEYTELYLKLSDSKFLLDTTLYEKTDTLIPATQ